MQTHLPLYSFRVRATAFAWLMAESCGVCWLLGFSALRRLAWRCVYKPLYFLPCFPSYISKALLFFSKTLGGRVHVRSSSSFPKIYMPTPCALLSDFSKNNPRMCHVRSSPAFPKMEGSLFYVRSSLALPQTYKTTTSCALLSPVLQ